METELEQLRQQLADANARIEELSTTIDQRTHERIRQLESTIAALTERAERAEKALAEVTKHGVVVKVTPHDATQDLPDLAMAVRIGDTARREAGRETNG